MQGTPTGLPWDEVIELFAGAGGMTWGWHRAGLRARAAVDNDSAAARSHELNFGYSHCLSLNRDLRTFTPEDLEELVGGVSGNLLAVVGGPPCQGWSKAGRGKLRSLRGRAHSLLDDPRNALYRQFVKYVAYFDPPVFVMENVPGMLNLEGRNVADEVVDNFDEIGFATSYALVNARWFGVPQDRMRLIFLGVRTDLDFTLEAGSLQAFAERFRATIAGLPGETNLKQALSDLPEVVHGAREDPQPYRRGRDRISRFAELMRASSNGNVTDHICREHNDMDLEAFDSMPEGGLYVDLPPRLQRYRTDIFPDKYRRLKWAGVSGTITAHLAKDCYQHIHPGQPRTISIREAARIQSFPDDFRFFGNMGDRFRQIGNAVPPLMAWGIAEYVRAQISGGIEK
jgi:DNA (cytosine-5)-methyltransferase 1